MSNEVTEYQFTPDERSVVEEYVAQVNSAQQQLQGALHLVARQRQLEGDWKLDGLRLVRVR